MEQTQMKSLFISAAAHEKLKFFCEKMKYTAVYLKDKKSIGQVAEEAILRYLEDEEIKQA